LLHFARCEPFYIIMQAEQFFATIQAQAYTLHKDKAKQFGIKSIYDSSLTSFWESRKDTRSALIRLGVWGVKNIETLQVEESCVLLGFKPTNSFHLGYHSVLHEFKYWGENGHKPIIVLGATELLLETGSLQEVTFRVSRSMSELNSILGNELCRHLIVDLGSNEWSHWEALSSRFIKLNKVKQLLGWDEKTSYDKLRVASLMVTSFLVPQFIFGKSLVTVVPTGINEAPYLELAKQVARRLGFIEPVSTYRELLRDITGSGRMSSKHPAKTIFFQENPEAIRMKLYKVATGGRAIKEHRRLGGIPQNCFFLRLVYPILSENELNQCLDSCLSGLSCSICKSNLIPIAVTNWQEHNR
jgi:tryptophanyl-tRNA synthetase